MCDGKSRRIVYRGDIYNAIEAKRIKTLEKALTEPYIDGVHDGLKLALFALASVEDVTDFVQTEWVSVKDRLPPKEKESYLCYTDAGVMCECRWTNNRFGLGASDIWGWNIMDVPQYQKITHWMPLPEPPNS